MSLGGFAEDESVVDGDWEAFNYCLAENYYSAMIGEEWDLIGESSTDLIDAIIDWLTYCEEIGKENTYDIEGIRNGNLITVNNRTFIDAIISDKQVDLAETYIRLGVKDIRLYILFMLYYKDEFYGLNDPMNTINYVYKGTILNAYLPYDRDDLIKFLSNIFSELDKIYNGLKKNADKKKFLSIVRFNINNFRYSKKIEKISFDEVCSPGFARILLKKGE
ncbi:MAG: hypothetical protein IJE89_03240 [Bacilli bacterium]|nr:hypothetical protein [Bacilli bacterium]